MKHSLEEIKAAVKELAEKINAPESLLPGFGMQVYDAHPYVEIDRAGHLNYVVVEQGKEIRRDLSWDLDDLLYRVFADITGAMAGDFEARHRIETEDSRRQRFTKQEELFGILNTGWKQRVGEYHRWIIRSYPFDDNGNARMKYLRQLKSAGKSSSDTWTEACKRFPFPKAE